jgi:hypothetical protein
MKITLTSDRTIKKIEADDFSLTLNGKTNAEYSKILSGLGVELIWEPNKPAPPPTFSPQQENK